MTGIDGLIEAVAERASIAATLMRSLDRATERRVPFRHWLLTAVLPEAVARAVKALPIEAQVIGDTAGRRDTHNASRVFFSEFNRARHPACGNLASVLQSPILAERLADLAGVGLGGSYLRIEYCQDRDGFWLEPHTDIDAKLLTFLIYLSEPADGEDLGTDLYDAELRPAGRAPGGFDDGLVFVPAGDTWHGFARRPIRGLRRSLIVNYVKDEWRSRHELAYPDRPVGWL